MTIRQYYAMMQPINDETNEIGEYKAVDSIDFKSEDGITSASILIAHVGNKLYAFGWRISDFPLDNIGHVPTAHAITKGNIQKLIYGMTKVLQSKLKPYNSIAIRKLLKEAEKEAEEFYTNKDLPVEHILISETNNGNDTTDDEEGNDKCTLEFI